jgi:hypothetical protein
MVEAGNLRYTVQPGITSKIVMKTLPDGICTLHPEEEVNPTRSLKLFADQDGIICFYIRPDDESDIVAKIIIDCEVDGNVTRFPLDLRASSKPTPEMPAPPLERLERSKNGHH